MRLLTTLLFCFIPSLLWASGTGSGLRGGGDPVVAEFAQKSRFILRVLSISESYYPFLENPMWRNLDKIKIESADGPLTLDDGTVVNAINIPDMYKIIIDRKKWRTLLESSKTQLILHELLSVNSLVEINYQTSEMLTRQYELSAKTSLDKWAQGLVSVDHPVNFVETDNQLHKVNFYEGFSNHVDFATNKGCALLLKLSSSGSTITLSNISLFLFQKRESFKEFDSSSNLWIHSSRAPIKLSASDSSGLAVYGDGQITCYRKTKWSTGYFSVVNFVEVLPQLRVFPTF